MPAIGPFQGHRPLLTPESNRSSSLHSDLHCMQCACAGSRASGRPYGQAVVAASGGQGIWEVGLEQPQQHMQVCITDKVAAVPSDR